MILIGNVTRDCSYVFILKTLGLYCSLLKSACSTLRRILASRIKFINNQICLNLEIHVDIFHFMTDIIFDTITPSMKPLSLSLSLSSPPFSFLLSEFFIMNELSFTTFNYLTINLHIFANAACLHFLLYAKRVFIF